MIGPASRQTAAAVSSGRPRGSSARRLTVAGVCAVVVVTIFAGDLRATPAEAPGGPPPPAADAELPAPSAAPGERRPVPHYDSRPEAAISPGQALAWVPRALLYPAQRVVESFVRFPLVRFLTWGEKHHLFRWAKEIFVWNGGEAGVFPTFYYEFGVDPSLGFFLFYNDLLTAGQRSIVRFGIWDEDWIHVMVENRIPLFREGRGTFSLAVQFLRRPDRPFYGLGPGTAQDPEVFFRIQRTTVELGLATSLGGLNSIGMFTGFRRVTFDDGQWPYISTVYDVTDPVQVPGFDGYNTAETRVELVLDSRDPDWLKSSGTGARLQLFGAFNADPDDADLHFFKWGGELAGFLDVTGANHVLGLRLFTAFVEEMGSEPVPISELVTLGGQELMRGFLEGRFRGPSALAVTLSYRYPIWAFVDADLFASLGNAFGEHLEGVALDRMFLSWGLALRTNLSRDISFDVLLAFGTNRLDARDLSTDSVRVALGFNNGF